jgi:hypothetical protein
VELYKDNGETSNQVRVIDPVERSVSPSSDKRLQQFFDSVNPSEVSKATNANGEPLVVFHGGSKGIEVFNVPHVGAWFSSGQIIPDIRRGRNLSCFPFH